MSRLDSAFPIYRSTRRSGYDWEKSMDKKTLERHKWLTKIWIELYSKNPDDMFVRKLSTDDMMKTRWFEKYGIKEPHF